MEAALDEIRAAEDGLRSSDTTLRSLRIAGIDIGAFDPDVRNYSAFASSWIENVRVTAPPNRYRCPR